MIPITALSSSTAQYEVQKSPSDMPSDMPADKTKKRRFGDVIAKTKHLAEPTPGLSMFLRLIESGQIRLPVGRDMEAIDLGPGGGRDSRAMCNKGWGVSAVDISPLIKEALSDVAGERLSIHVGTLEDARFERESFDLINAQRVLPFIQGASMENTLKEAARVLRTGGYMNVSFFGPGHSWNDSKHQRVSFHSEEEITGLLKDAGFQVMDIERRTDPAKAASGETVPKWDEIRVIARKKMPPPRHVLADKLHDVAKMPKV